LTVQEGGNDDSSMLIRRAEDADEKALASIRHGAILELATPAMSGDEAGAWALRPAADRIARAIREHEVWVADEEEAIGWVEVDRDRVAALYVSPRFARRGVGSSLLQVAEAAIRSAGHAAAHLDASRNALDFYRRRGYLPSGSRRSDGSYPMRKDLAALTGPGARTIVGP
jgi:putative acetyltransferase